MYHAVGLYAFICVIHCSADEIEIVESHLTVEGCTAVSLPLVYVFTIFVFFAMSPVLNTTRRQFCSVIGRKKDAVKASFLFLFATVLTLSGLSELDRLCSGAETSVALCREGYTMPSLARQGSEFNGKIVTIPAPNFFLLSAALQILAVLATGFFIIIKKVSKTKIILLAALGISTVLMTVSTMGLVKYMAIRGAKISAFGFMLQAITNTFLIVKLEATPSVKISSNEEHYAECVKKETCCIPIHT